MFNIDMEKVEENKTELEKQIAYLEKDLTELSETEPEVAKYLMNELDLFKILLGNKQNDDSSEEVSM